MRGEDAEGLEGRKEYNSYVVNFNFSLNNKNDENKEEREQGKTQVSSSMLNISFKCRLQGKNFTSKN